MKNFKTLSKAEMKKVSGGIINPDPRCATDRYCNIVVDQWPDGTPGGYGYPGICSTTSRGACVCVSIAGPQTITQQTGDCYE